MSALRRLCRSKYGNTALVPTLTGAFLGGGVGAGLGVLSSRGTDKHTRLKATGR